MLVPLLLRFFTCLRAGLRVTKVVSCLFCLCCRLGPAVWGVSDHETLSPFLSPLIHSCALETMTGRDIGHVHLCHQQKNMHLAPAYICFENITTSAVAYSPPRAWTGGGGGLISGTGRFGERMKTRASASCVPTTHWSCKRIRDPCCADARQLLGHAERDTHHPLCPVGLWVVKKRTKSRIQHEEYLYLYTQNGPGLEGVVPASIPPKR